jgi:peptidoglycan L-alanyl-D-glutamate endopeptidase CwlK
MSLRNTTKKIQKLVGAKQDGVYGPNTAARILAALQSDSTEPPPAPEIKAELDARTLKNLRTLEAKAQEKFLPFIRKAKAIAASMGCDYVAISGTRGEKEQNDLYAKGRTKPGRKVTNAKYGYSNHNFGIALDFGVFQGRKYLDGDNPKKAAAVHKAVAALAEEHGIDWGGNWRSFKDIPHFEIKTSLTTAQKRARLFSGKTIL